MISKEALTRAAESARDWPYKDMECSSHWMANGAMTISEHDRIAGDQIDDCLEFG